MEEPLRPKNDASAGSQSTRLLRTLSAPSWQRELRETIRTADGLHETLSLSEPELRAARQAERDGFPIAIPPHYLSLIDLQDPHCPIRRQVVPAAAEKQTVPGDLRDPLGEEAHEVAPELIQRYPDRALLLLTDRCAVYCRFCTRSRMVGSGGGARSMQALSPALSYLREHPEVRDLIISGGDPLMLKTDKIATVLEALRQIPSIETIRIATRVPVVLPSRISDELVQALRPHHPIWIMTHFNHPKELHPAALSACERLADGGFPVMNHTVLMHGVNDDAATLAKLFRGLVKVRVRPYYLLQADPVRGTAHLRTPLSASIELMEALQGRLSGIALPKLIVDTPGGFGKVPVGPDYVLQRSPGVTRFRTPRGVDVDYFDP